VDRGTTKPTEEEDVEPTGELTSLPPAEETEDEAAEDVQQVKQIGRVFGQPAIRLDAVER